MDKITLYPELIEYIFEFCDEFQTLAEKLAVKTFRHDRPDLEERTREMYIKTGWINEGKDVRRLMASGFGTFKEDLAIRILKEHHTELLLNLCPVCGKIARTPQAKQCRFCFHDWH